MDSPKWLVSILDRIHSFHSDDLDPVEAAQIICQRFEAALKRGHSHPTRVYDEGCEQRDATRKAWYNQPDQETPSGE